DKDITDIYPQYKPKLAELYSSRSGPHSEFGMARPAMVVDHFPGTSDKQEQQLQEFFQRPGNKEKCFGLLGRPAEKQSTFPKELRGSLLGYYPRVVETDFTQ